MVDQLGKKKKQWGILETVKGGLRKVQKVQ
jgi:hypothetical protein